MTPGPPLSEEEETAERSDRDELRRLEGKIREMRPRRQGLVEEVRRLSDEQHDLVRTRAPRQAALDATHAEHQALGRELANLRRQRDEARRKLDAALVNVREFRALTPKGEHAPPEHLRREIAELEMRQQTHALPIAEENALILRLRELTKSLQASEKERAVVDERHAKLKALETALTDARREVDRLGGDLAKAHTERDRRMQAMREHLLEDGRLVAAIRDMARARGAAMERLEAANREVIQLERSADALVARLRGRRKEARDNIRDYNRTVRDSIAGPDAYARAADAQLAELLKRGRITLNG